MDIWLSENFTRRTADLNLAAVLICRHALLEHHLRCLTWRRFKKEVNERFYNQRYRASLTNTELKHTLTYLLNNKLAHMRGSLRGEPLELYFLSDHHATDTWELKFYEIRSQIALNSLAATRAREDYKPTLPTVDLGEFLNDVEEDPDAATMLGTANDFDLDAEGSSAEDPGQSADLPSSQAGDSMFDKSAGPGDASFFGEEISANVQLENPQTDMPSSFLRYFYADDISFSAWQVLALLCLVLLMLIGGITVIESISQIL